MDVGVDGNGFTDEPELAVLRVHRQGLAVTRVELRPYLNVFHDLLVFAGHLADGMVVAGPAQGVHVVGTDAKLMPELAQIVFDDPALVAAAALGDQFVEGVAVLGEHLGLGIAPIGRMVVRHGEKNVGLERDFLSLGGVNAGRLGLEDVAVTALKRVALNKAVLVLHRPVFLHVVASKGVAFLVVSLGLSGGRGSAN